MKKFIIISIILLALDQFTKYIFTGKEYLVGSFGIYYAENTGAAFGILSQMNIFLILVGFLVLFLIFYFYNDVKCKLPFILIFAGTLGNVIDRLLFGYVRDFILISIWPIFNVADMCNTIGVLILLYCFWREDKTYKQKSHKK
ncbi:signal peptidase II [archaeon]|jgi:signal peptidase II|nr:signal peptidase II [archaeon]MBT4397771.1 signal peptidase II [archaeon]MBT4441074.1 signal peptidase II [archaeon]